MSAPLVWSEPTLSVKYVAPERSPIILSLRISGIVHLRIQAEPTTGRVTNVEVVRGAPLLAAEAVRAARLWQFEPSSIADLPIDVHVNSRWTAVRSSDSRLYSCLTAQ